MDKIMS